MQHKTGQRKFYACRGQYITLPAYGQTARKGSVIGDTSNGETVLTPRQSALLASFDQLNEEGQTKAVEYVEDLVLTGRYKKCPASELGAKEA